MVSWFVHRKKQTRKKIWKISLKFSFPRTLLCVFTAHISVAVFLKWMMRYMVYMVYVTHSVKRNKQRRPLDIRNFVDRRGTFILFFFGSTSKPNKTKRKRNKNSLRKNWIDFIHICISVPIYITNIRHLQTKMKHKYDLFSGKSCFFLLKLKALSGHF